MTQNCTITVFLKNKLEVSIFLSIKRQCQFQLFQTVSVASVSKISHILDVVQKKRARKQHHLDLDVNTSDTVFNSNHVVQQHPVNVALVTMIFKNEDKWIIAFDPLLFVARLDALDERINMRPVKIRVLSNRTLLRKKSTLVNP